MRYPFQNFRTEVKIENRSNNQAVTRGRQTQLRAYRQRENASLVMGDGQRHISVSSLSLPTEKASERSKRGRSRKLSRSRQRSYRLDVAPVNTQRLGATTYRKPVRKRSNIGGYYRFCFDYAQMLEVCLSFCQTF